MKIYCLEDKVSNLHKVSNLIELKELVSIHGEANHGPLTLDEITIIKGALDLKNKKVASCMTPLDSVFMLPVEQKLDKETLKMVRQHLFV